jgi:adenine-specific DNA-methyltransferase
VWPERYPSKHGFIVEYMHEQAFVLAKGSPPYPTYRLPDILPWEFSGNALHPTQKAVSVMKPLILAFSKPGGLHLIFFSVQARLHIYFLSEHASA